MSPRKQPTIRQAQEALEHERSFTVLEMAGVLVVVLDRQGTIVRFNQECERVTGYRFDDVRGRQLWDCLLPPEQHDAFRAAFDHLTAGQGLSPSRFESVCVTKAGDRRSIAWSNTTIADETGAIRYVIGCGVDTTERRHVEEALRLSEERFALAMQAANDGLWDRNLETNEVYYSPRWRSILGYAEDELEYTMTAFEELVHPDDRARRREAVNAYVHGTAARYEIELRIRHKDGHYVPILSRATAAKGADGRVVRLIGTHVDLSEQKRTEQRTAAQHAATRVLAEATTLKEMVPEFLRAICEAAGWDLGCALVVDPDAKHLRGFAVWRSPSVEAGDWEANLLGRSYLAGQGLAGRVWATGQPEWIPRPGASDDFPPDARAAGMNSVCVAPFVIGRQNSAVLEFYSRDIRLRDDAWFNLLASVNIQVEQTLQRKRMELELGEAERKYRDIVEQSLHGIYQTTPEGRIIRVNPAFARTLGYESSDEIVTFEGRMADQLYVDPGRREEFRRLIEANGSALGFEARMRRKDGAVIWVSIDARAVKDGSGAIKYYEGSLVDITDRKEADQMKSDFVSFATHQLRTPLAGIKWMLELAQAPDLPEEIASYIQDARTSADRLIRLVNDLLDVSRLESGRFTMSPQPTDLAAVTSQVVSELLPLAREKSQSLLLEPSTDIPPVLVDPKLAREVILNLISNALRYTPEGGAITTRMHAADGGVEWAVRDTGIGIPASAQSRLFEKFYRADNAFVVHTEGTGLGLYLVRLIVERSGGRAWCESTEGAGSTFRFTLPVAE
jgi:PAS domain S-box-containing protein